MMMIPGMTASALMRMIRGEQAYSFKEGRSPASLEEFTDELHARRGKGQE